MEKQQKQYRKKYVPEESKDKRQRSRSRSRSSESNGAEQKVNVIQGSPEGQPFLILEKGKNLVFQGAVKLKVFHGEVQVFGCPLRPEDGWQDVISDPRKTMLLDIQSQSQCKSTNVVAKLDDGKELDVGQVPDNASVIALTEYKDYSPAEEPLLIPKDQTLKLRNATVQRDPQKSLFVINKSWHQALENIKSQIVQKPTILVSGPPNTAKSTFTSCLVNQLLSSSHREVYFLELDPGQPNYTMAGQVCLLRLNQKILTNHDFKKIEYIKGYYLNSATPSTNMGYYVRSTAALMKDFDDIKSPNKVLIVNTCGWVDGLGADIQMNVMDRVRPTTVITMKKFNQGLKENDFIQRCKYDYPQLDFMFVVNDPFEQINIKGAVQRNRKILHALTYTEQDEYTFNAKQIDAHSSLPLTFHSKSFKNDDFSMSKSQAFQIQSKPTQSVSFSKAALVFISQDLNLVYSKIDALRLFNCQLVAGIKIDKAQFRSLQSFEDVRVTEVQFTDKNLQPIEFKFYGLVKDVDYNQGLKMVTQFGMDISKVNFNAICLVYDSIFKFPSSYLVQGDVEDQMMSNGAQYQGQTQYFMHDFKKK